MYGAEGYVGCHGFSAEKITLGCRFVFLFGLELPNRPPQPQPLIPIDNPDRHHART